MTQLPADGYRLTAKIAGLQLLVDPALAHPEKPSNAGTSGASIPITLISSQVFQHTKGPLRLCKNKMARALGPVGGAPKGGLCQTTG